jgi:hypothetical protein
MYKNIIIIFINWSLQIIVIIIYLQMIVSQEENENYI